MAMAGLPLSKGRPLCLVTKHIKFNYSGKGELCCQHRRVIHMRWTPLLFCFPQCFHYDGSFLSFGCGRLRTCHCLIWCHFARVLFHEQTICLSSAFTSLLLEAQTLCPSAVSAAGAFDVQVSQLTVLWFVCFFWGWFIATKTTTKTKTLTRSLKPALCCSSICFSLAASAISQMCRLAVFYVYIVKNAT